MTLAQTAAGDATIRVGPFVKLPQLLAQLGHDPASLLAEQGFQLQDFQEPDKCLAFLRTSQLLEHCVRVTGVDHLGLLLGQMASASHLGLAGFMLASAPSVEVALQDLVNNLDLHDQGGVISLDALGEHNSLRYSLLLPDTAAVAQIYDLAAVMMYQIMRKLCGDDWKADSVSLERHRPTDTTPYSKFFDTQVYFNATENAITFSNRWLAVAPGGSDPYLYRHLSTEATQLHEDHKQEFMEMLPRTLHRALLSGQFSSGQVASALGLHERTLHRRLKAAGSSFRQELDNARQALSEELLGSTSLPVCDIATTLGYADSSGFIRAFQRWCGTSPTAWRRAHRARPGATA